MTIAASLVDETIDESMLLELNNLLDGNSELQLLYKRYMDLHCHFHWNAHLLEIRPTPKPSKKWMTALGGVAAMIGVFFIVNHFLGISPHESKTVAVLSGFEGTVVVTDKNGETRTALAGLNLHPGDVVESRGTDNKATLTFGDGSRFLLVGESSMALHRQIQKKVILHRGRLMASIREQSAPDQFEVSTPHANIVVLGTKFTLESLPEQTSLEVLHGRVGAISPAAPSQVKVSQGEFLVARKDQPLVVKTSSQGDGGWTEDFEDGLPENWHSGILESKGLPGNSKGGVRTVKNVIANQDYYQVITPQEWTRGLFTYRGDMHLQVTFKMEHPDWANIFFIARTAEIENHETFLHKFTIPFRPSSDDVWWKLTVPLSDFQLKTDNGFEAIPPAAGEVVFGFSFSAPAPDRGMVIDEIAILPNGPGKAVYQRLEPSE